jgi:thiosulfate/3-mercaptopyruvate sulfurtransferase
LIIDDNHWMPLLMLLVIALQTGYSRPELLVDTAWLAAHLDDPAIRVVDMRPRGYDDGHIPGAVWLDNNAIRIAGRPPYFLPTPAEFELFISRLGI